MPSAAKIAQGTCDVGLLGPAGMGQNPAPNKGGHRVKGGGVNRETKTKNALCGAHPSGSFGRLGGGLTGLAALEDFVRAIKRPRRIVIMVKAGPPTDAVIDGLAGLLSDGDIIVDGGNAHWEDTIRREKALWARRL